ncbi:hypothetical protein FPOAC1_000103 [Fusarium poae]|uniref:hypothetical protein n=1 Tax=Fusarium poae TaxID=36050 RepID=UPI001CEBAF92|nr:hypothetical protein FPOAC1_000103 [Fusarium poae]KAG8674140.1 hypothetical protein FPOAC1_000103 [Fusarium poae]
MSESDESETGASPRPELVKQISRDLSSEKDIEEQSTSPEDQEDAISDASSNVSSNVSSNASSDVTSEISDIATFNHLLVPGVIGGLNRRLGLARYWGFSNFDDYDVITVHGLRDNHRTVWISKTGAAWLKHSLFQELSIRQLDYVYALDESAQVFRPDGIEIEARNLLRSYCQLRQSLLDTEVNRPIIWVCHDIGGNIVKKVLMEATQPVLRDDYKDDIAWESAKVIHHKIATLSTAILFLGCPHKSESLEVLQDEVLNLMDFPGPEITNGRLGKIKNIARQVESINESFLKCRLFYRLTTINVSHLADFPEVGSKGEPMNNKLLTILDTTNDPETGAGVTQIDQVHRPTPAQDSTPTSKELPVALASPFSQYTVSTFINTMEKQNEYYLTKVDHPNLVRGVEYPNGDTKWLRSLSRRFRENVYPFKVDPYLARFKTALLSVIPPIKIPTIHMEHRKGGRLPVMDWLTSQDIYRVLKTKLGPQLIHIEANETDQKRVSMLSQYLYTLYDSENEGYWDDNPKGQSFYFEFVKSDHRYNNVRSMLLTFLNHAAWHCSFDTDIHARKGLAQLMSYKCWSLTQLFNLFATVRGMTNAADLVIFLGSFDNCIEDERRWFLAAIQEHQSHGDIDYRVVTTTSGSDEISKTLIDKSQTLSLGNCPVQFLGYSIDEEGVGVHSLHMSLKHLLQKRPVLHQVETTVLALLEDCKNVPRHGYVILQWLKTFGRGASLATITAALERLRPVTAKTILNELLRALSNKRRQWALQVHRWVRYAKEPLTPKALGQALALSATQNPGDIRTTLLDYDYECLVDEVQKCFSGIIVIEGGEVKLSHDSFDQSITLDGDNNETENPSYIHGAIATTCLQYMMQDCVQQQFARLSADNYAGDELKYPFCIAGQDLLEYAVRFWADHYRLADNHRPFELALGFFRAKHLRDKLAEAVYLLSNPSTRMQQSYCSPLPLMAYFGLDDLVSTEVDESKEAEWFQKDISLAIVEAARNNQSFIFSNLLELVEADEASLKEAIFWAAAAQNEDIMIKILDKVATLKSFEWNQSLLSCAAITGSNCLATAIAKSGFNLNQVDVETGQTALNAAIFWRQRVVVETLLNFEIDLSTRDHEDMTPLVVAVEVADQVIVQMLLDRGARVDQKTHEGELIVTRAAEVGNHVVLDQLISAGAQFQVDAGDTDMVEPTIRTAQKHRKECLRILLEHGANPCAESRDGSLLYQFCTKRDTVDICRLLLEKGANPNETYSDKEMLLIRGLRTDNTELVGLLIDQGANINAVDPWEEGVARTPLSFAAGDCDLDMIELLLDRGADVNYAPEGVDAALFSAAYRTWDTERLELFLKRGAKTDWRREDGWQALHAVYDAPNSVKVLLKHEADINAMCVGGTVTMLAARNGYKSTLEVIIANQDSTPDLDAKLTYDPDDEDYGATAIRLAAEAGHYDCASFLLESGACLDDEMKDAKFFIRCPVENMSTEQSQALFKLMEQCFEYGTKADVLDERQNTVLHYLDQNTPEPLISSLLRFGAPMDSTNADGSTPLVIALERRNISAARLLLSRGARADIYSPRFGSLLHIVCNWHRNGNLLPVTEFYTLLKILIQRKADPHMPGFEPLGESILYTAIARIHFNRVSEMTARYLIEELQIDVNYGGRMEMYPLIAAIWQVYPRLINYLIRHGADLEVADDQGLKPCHYAAMRRKGNHKTLELVTRSGIALQARDLYDRTPLHFVSTNLWYTAESFIKRLPADFDVNVKDSDGWTPLMWACRLKDSWETAQHLVEEYGADIWARSNDGQWSPLKLANLADFEQHFKSILKPPKDKMERVLENGSKEVWDAAFHVIPPGIHHLGKFCGNCIMVSSANPSYISIIANQTRE